MNHITTHSFLKGTKENKAAYKVLTYLKETKDTITYECYSVAQWNAFLVMKEKESQ
jgi:hypothetical protein